MSAEDEPWMSLCVTVCSARDLAEPASNLRCVVDFDGYEWETKALKKATAEPVWEQSFELGPFEDDNDLIVRCLSRSTTLGMVRLRVGDLLPDGLTQKEYALVDDEDKSTPGSLKLSVTFIEKAAKDSRKKVGFWRRLYSFLLGGRRNGPNDASDGETNDDQSNASASNSASGTPRESTDGAAAGADDSAVPSTIVIQDNQDEGASEGLLFGRPLAEILENQRERHADLSVPWFIWAAARSIREKEGLIDTMGLFRVRGRLAQIKELKNMLNAGTDIDIDGLLNENPNNIHNITSLIKTFLRELPTPLISFDYYDEFLRCADYSGHKQEKRILRTIRKLPPENYTLIKFLCHLMYDVGLHSGVNMMNAENLSKVLSPNLIWKETVNLSDLSQVIDMKKANDLAQVMITHYYELFEGATVYSDPSASEEEESFSDVSSDDDDDDAGGRGGLDSLIEQMKKGQFLGKSGAATATSTSTTTSTPSPLRRPGGTK